MTQKAMYRKSGNQVYGIQNCSPFLPGLEGGVTSLRVRRGCAPVLGSFWPENSGIGIYFYWKISVIGYAFTWNFLGLGFTVTPPLYSKF